MIKKAKKLLIYSHGFAARDEMWVKCTNNFSNANNILNIEKKTKRKISCVNVYHIFYQR